MAMSLQIPGPGPEQKPRRSVFAKPPEPPKIPLPPLPTEVQVVASSPEQESDKMRRIRVKIATEIRDTEASYVQSLTVLRDIVIPAVRDNLGDEITNKLFSNIDTITMCNLKFYEDICKLVVDGMDSNTLIGPVFNKMAPFFKMYTSYVSNHDLATETLGSLSKNSKFIKIQQTVMMDARLKGLGLASFLIMPIQRIPRYKLLLTELLKNTPPEHADYKNLETALEAVGKVATHVNDAIKAQQNRQIVMSIQKQFTSNVTLVNPSRYFVRQGPMTKKCRASEIVYEFFLFNDLLLYASKQVGKYKLHRMFEISKKKAFGVKDLPDEGNNKFRFQVLHSDKSFTVYTTSEDVKRGWLADLSVCIESREKRIGTEKDEFHKAPVWQSDHDSDKCPKCRESFTFFNRRHHCRSCGVLVCGNCSKSKERLPTSTSSEKLRVCDDCAKSIRQSEGVGSPSNKLGMDSNRSSMSTGAGILAASNQADDDESTDEEEERQDIQEKRDEANKREISNQIAFMVKNRRASNPNVGNNLASSLQGLANVGSQQTLQISVSSANAETEHDSEATNGEPVGYFVCRSKFPYVSQQQGDLMFDADEILHAFHRSKNGWLAGRKTKKRPDNDFEVGIFPANFVEEDTSMKVALPWEGCAVCSVDYTANSATEMTVRQGDIVCVRQSDPGGWYYCLNLRNESTGWVYRTCITFIVNESSTDPNPEQSLTQSSTEPAQVQVHEPVKIQVADAERFGTLSDRAAWRASSGPHSAESKAQTAPTTVSSVESATGGAATLSPSKPAAAATNTAESDAAAGQLRNVSNKRVVPPPFIQGSKPATSATSNSNAVVATRAGTQGSIGPGSQASPSSPTMRATSGGASNSFGTLDRDKPVASSPVFASTAADNPVPPIGSAEASSLPSEPTASKASGEGACNLCTCTKFKPNRFKPAVCGDCQHKNINHIG